MSETQTDPLTAARIAKEQKIADGKGKHKSVNTTTIGRKGKIQGKGGMTFTTDGEGADSTKVVKRERSAGYSITNSFANGAIGVGSILPPEKIVSNSENEDDN